MTPEELDAHEKAIDEVARLVLTYGHGLSIWQAKDRAEQVVRSLGQNKVSYLIGQAVILIPSNYSVAARNLERARERLERFRADA